MPVDLRRLAVIVAVLAAVGAAPAHAQWQQELTEEIREALGCEVEFLTEVIERTVDGQRHVMAKVHCRDRRTFDAIRRGDDEFFEFHICEQPDVRTC